MPYIKRISKPSGKVYYYYVKRVKGEEVYKPISEEQALEFENNRVPSPEVNRDFDRVDQVFAELKLINRRLVILELEKNNGNKNNVVPLQNVPKKNNSNTKPISLSVLQSGKTYGANHGALMSELKSVLKNRRQDA